MFDKMPLPVDARMSSLLQLFIRELRAAAQGADAPPFELRLNFRSVVVWD